MSEVGDLLLKLAEGKGLLILAIPPSPCPQCGPDSPREAGHEGHHRHLGLGGGKW